MKLEQADLSVSGLLNHYRAGDFTPRDFLTYQLGRIRDYGSNPAWISILDEAGLEIYLQRLEEAEPADLPLYGVPFAIKDNIDLAGLPTTAACPDFSYQPDQSATVVQKLVQAGAVPLGKTNMDQFATGLVGTRSPYGVCHSVFSREHISGGSSSGSAVAVAEGLVAFALGTDTAGSGRVPAACNNLVGLKPSRGLLSNTGMVRACRSLDCISIFACCAADAQLVFDQARGTDDEDEYGRKLTGAPLATRDRPKVIVPLDSQLDFAGDSTSEAAHRDCLGALADAGWDLQPTDFSTFFEAARLLYQGPWVAERQAAFGEFASSRPESVLPLINQILAPAAGFSAEDLFNFQYRLQQLKVAANRLLDSADFALTPTLPTQFRIHEIQADPIGLNSRLGTYTNFMNLLDLSAVAVPAGFTAPGLPWGITLFAPAFHDYRLLGFAHCVQKLLPLPLGKSGQARLTELPPARLDDRIQIAVCGAHMSGLALNHQLLERDGLLVETTRTSACYRLYALPGGPPSRPALAHDPDSNYAIDLELWSLPQHAIGSLLELIPPPLGLGKVELADGRWVSSFICEPRAPVGAEDISHLGSWRTWLSQQS